MELIVGARVYLPGFGPGIVTKIESRELGGRLCYIRLRDSESSFSIPETVAIAIGVRDVLAPEGVGPLLRRVSRNQLPKRIVPERWILSSRPDDLFRILQAELVGDLPEDPQSAFYGVEARRLLAQELAEATDQTIGRANTLVDEALRAWRQFDARRDLVARSTTESLPRALVAVDFPFRFLTVTTDLPATLGFSSLLLRGESRENTIYEIRRLFEEGTLGTVLIPPVLLTLGVPAAEIETHTKTLIESDRSFSLPSSTPIERDVVMMCLYPSGAVRTTSWTTAGVGRCSLGDPLALLDPDRDPELQAGIYLHRLVVVGFEILR